MEDYLNVLRKEREKAVRRLVRLGFERGALSFSGKGTGTQKEADARSVIVYLVTRKAAELGMGYSDAAEVLGCSYQHVINCCYKCRGAERDGNRPFLKWLLNAVRG